MAGLEPPTPYQLGHTTHLHDSSLNNVYNQDYYNRFPIHTEDGQNYKSFALAMILVDDLINTSCLSMHFDVSTVYSYADFGEFAFYRNETLTQ